MTSEGEGMNKCSLVVALEYADGMNCVSEVPEPKSSVVGRGHYKSSRAVGANVGQLLVVTGQLDNQFARLVVIDVGHAVPGGGHALVDACDPIARNDNTLMTR